MSSTPSDSGKGPAGASAVLPFSFIVLYKEPVDAGFQDEFLKKVKALCAKNPTSAKGEKLPGVTVEYKDVLKGFAGQFHPDVVAEMQKEKRVQVMPDGVLEFANYGPWTDTNTSSWALAEISRDLTMPFDPTQAQQFKYHGSKLGGEGITIWILDGGCNNVVNELPTDRVTQEPWQAAPVVVRSSAEQLLDAFSTGQRHGTNVAATAAGSTVGAAPKARVRAIQLASPEGVLPAVTNTLSALEYIKKNEANPHLCVVNCSWGKVAETGDLTRGAIAEAIMRMTESGFTVVVAAGNGERQTVNGQTKSVGVKLQPTSRKTIISDVSKSDVLIPASLTSVITVGALGKDRKPTEWSNYGTPVDIWAPGSEIPSVSDFKPGQITQGTSFSAPLVSGIIACMLAEKHRDEPAHKMTTDEIKKQLESWGWKEAGKSLSLHNGRPLLS